MTVAVVGVFLIVTVMMTMITDYGYDNDDDDESTRRC